MSSACANGDLPVSLQLKAELTAFPSNVTIAPMGTSPFEAARRANFRVSFIHLTSSIIGIIGKCKPWRSQSILGFSLYKEVCRYHRPRTSSKVAREGQRGP